MALIVAARSGRHPLFDSFGSNHSCCAPHEIRTYSRQTPQNNNTLKDLQFAAMLHGTDGSTAVTESSQSEFESSARVNQCWMRVDDPVTREASKRRTLRLSGQFGRSEITSLRDDITLALIGIVCLTMAG